MNKNIFLDENEISFYLLGAYMSDGNISLIPRSKNFNIGSKDKDWLEIIRNLISKSINLQQRSDNYFILKCFDLDIIDWLVSYGCIPNKSLSLEIKKEIPKKYQKDFIRGVLDGDGSVSVCKYKKYKNNKEYEYIKVNAYICSSSKKFIKQLSNFVDEIGIKYSLIEISPGRKSLIRGREIIAKHSIWRIHFNDSNAKKFLAWIYNDNKISLPRKEKIVKNLLQAG